MLYQEKEVKDESNIKNSILVGSGDVCQQYVRRKHLGLVNRSMALQGDYSGGYPLSARLHRLPAFCGRHFRFPLLVINTLITKHYECND